MPFEVSMLDLFPACVDVLEEAKTPLHYRELTERGLAKIGKDKSLVNFEKEIENVREKLLLARRRGTFYTKSPLCMGALTSWFRTEQLQLFHGEEIVIPGNAQAGITGAFEGLMRSPFMLQKEKAANTERLNYMRAQGLVLQEHVALWFKEHWPMFYKEARNYRQWANPCNHDFILNVGNHAYMVDVTGPDKHGCFGKKPRKPTTDIHLTCYPSGKFCIWNGVLRGSEFKETVIPETASSPISFVVWLNCHKNGINYSEVARKANRLEVAA